MKKYAPVTTCKMHIFFDFFSYYDLRRRSGIGYTNPHCCICAHMN